MVCARFRTSWGSGVGGVVGLAMLAGAAACGAPPGTVPVPTFAAAAPTSTAPDGPGRSPELPADCEQLLGRDEVPALLALPTGSVAVRTVVGVPAPSVGRLQRTDCSYAVTGPDAGRLGVVLRLTVGRYRDAAAARDQHDRNVADAQAGASGSRQPDLGDATAVLVDRADGSALLTRYDTLTVDLDLAPGPAPLPPAELLTDLARRVLARLGASRTAPAP